MKRLLPPCITVFTCWAALGLFRGPVLAAPGELDPTFGNQGIVTTAFDNVNVGGNSVAVQTDGKIVVAGGLQGTTPTGLRIEFALTRYLPDGTLDPSFGDGGKVASAIGVGGFLGRGMVLRDDGKIIVSGAHLTFGEPFVVARFNSNGTVDTDFGIGGKSTTDIGVDRDEGNCVALQADGKIVVAGTANADGDAHIALVRYHPSGALDTSFGSAGKVTTDIGSGRERGLGMTLQSDGKILVVGDVDSDGINGNFALIRYNTNGTLDTSFGTGGIVTTGAAGVDEYATDVAVQSDGKIVAVGTATTSGNRDIAVLRYHPNGSLDTDFGTGGKVTIDFGNDNDFGSGVIVQPDGKIVVTGQSSPGSNADIALLRFNADGTLDTSFGNGGKVTSPIGTSSDSANALALQNDGTILVTGITSNSVAKKSEIALLRYKAADSASPAVTTDSASGISSSGATLNGMVNPGDLETTVSFEYGLTSTYGTTVNASASSVTGTTATPASIPLSGLQPRTTYYYRIVATNSKGTSYGDPATFTTLNSTPVATGDSATATRGRSVAIDVRSNDNDPDGDSVTIEAVTPAQHGKITIRNGIVHYTPDAGFSGEDSFSYTIRDAFGGTSTGTVAVTVAERPEDPVSTLLSAKGQAVPGAGEENSGTEALPPESVWATFGAPAINDGGTLAFAATVRAGKETHAGIFTRSAESEDYTLVAQKGDPVPGLQSAPGANGPVFSTLKDPVLDHADSVAFLATLSGPGTSKANNEGVFTTAYGGLEILARKGEQAADLPDGVVWSSFLNLALPDGIAGPLFVAKLTGPRSARIGGSNDVGLWGVDSKGELRLLLREGQPVGDRTLKSFVVLSTVAGSSGQTRSFNQAGEVAVRAHFTDGSQGLVTVQVP